MDKPIITKECVVPVVETPFVKLYDLQYAPGKHYYDATRRSRDEVIAAKSLEEFQSMRPDAVSCFVILELPDEEPRLLLFYEFRYPAGQFLLSVPAGLIDDRDAGGENPMIATAKREIFEETGVRIKDTDRVELVNPLVFSTPGMTDESNALVCAVVKLDTLDGLTQKGAEGTECFDGFKLVTKAEATQILKDGRDEFGNFYSMFTWAAMLYFVTDFWKK